MRGVKNARSPGMPTAGLTAVKEMLTSDGIEVGIPASGRKIGSSVRESERVWSSGGQVCQRRS